MGDLHNIDDLFKAGLEGQEEAPGEKVWNAIESDLDKNSAISIRKKYVQMRRASAVLLILLLGVSIYALRNNFINSNDNTAPKHMLRSGSVKPDSANDKSLQESADGQSNKQGPTSSLPAIDQDMNNLVTEKSAAQAQTAEETSSSADNITGTATGKSSAKNNVAVTPGNSSSHTLQGSAGNNNSAKQKTGITRDQRNAIAAGTIITAGAQGNENRSGLNNKNKSSSQKGNSITQDTQQEIVTNVDATSPNREMASVESASRQMPGNTARISSDNALSDAVKSNPANNLSIPVKNRKNNQLDLPRFSITPMASLNLMSNKIEGDPSHPGQGNEVDDIEETEKEKLSYTYSLLFDVKIAKRLTIQTGIGYMQKTTSIDPKQIPAVKGADGKIKYQFDCSAGRYYLNPKYGTWPRVGDSAYTIASANELHYINVPLAVKYYFGNNKLNFFALAGADANFLLGQDLTTGLYGASYYGKKTPPKPIGLNNVFVSAMLGGGINYSLNRWLGLTFSPTYRFALNPINKDMPFKAYPRNFSLAGGVRFSF